MSSVMEPSITTKNRLVALLVVIALLFGLLSIRLGYIQIVQAKSLQEKALGQWTRNLTVTAKRGDITDRNGQVLAQSASAYTIVVVPKEVVADTAKENAQKLADLLELEVDTVYAKMLDKTKQQHNLKRQVRMEVSDNIVSLKIKGVMRVEDTIRAYPMSSLASQLIGFTDVSGQGQTGIEQELDKYLAGVDGRILTEIDMRQRQLPFSADEYVAPEHGNDVVLTIDYVIQSFAEKAARDAMEINLAKKVWVIVMDVKTGEILAMVNKPDFDLNNPPRNDMDLLNQLSRNGAVTDAYEPGSTFKILTTSAAIDTGITNLNATYNCTGSIMVDGDKIRCWRTGLPHGHQTLTQAVMNSCNPVFVQLALAMGRDTFYDYLGAFGLGQKTNIPIRGESTGQVISIKYVKDVDLARIGFGQSISLTPLQLITAGCATVNGGNLMKPQIISKIVSDEGEVLQSYQPEVVSKPISKETSDIMRGILEEVVKDGGGRNAFIPGYRVGGKTGTAQKYDESGRIMKDVHVSSFIGFAPMNDPKIAVLFVVDEPGVRPDYGSTVAAPFARDILADTLQYMGIKPQYEEGEAELVGQTVEVPSMLEKKASDAIDALAASDLRYILDGDTNAVVTEQMPAAGTIVPSQSIVVLYTDNVQEQRDLETHVVIPDVTGMSVVEANRTLRHMGLAMRFSGSGLAVMQVPEAGTKIERGESIKVTFETP